MSELDRIVDIVITRDTTTIASANFSTPLLLTKTATAPVAVFRSAKEVLDAGYLIDSVEYLSAQAHFLVENHPPEFKIAEWDTVATPTIVEAMYAVTDIDNDFYGVLLGDISVADDYVALVEWAEDNGKFVFAGEADETGLATLTDLKALGDSGVGNGCCIVNTSLRTGDAVNGYADVSFASTILGKQIGSYTTVYKKLKGMTPDNLTTTQIDAIENLNGNYYETVYGEDLTNGGKTIAGEWIDVEIGIDWVEVRMQESVFKTIINLDKIPYTDKGTNVLLVAVTRVLDLGVKYGLFASYETTKEPVADQTQEDKANRQYNGISWNATLAGAIHTVKIFGNVEV